MRHKKFGRKLGRNHHQRQALFKGLARSLFISGSVNTTQAKAKAVVPLVEKICALAQKNNLVSRRTIFSYFQNRTLVNRINQSVNLAFKDQHSNFTQIIPAKYRQGDNALLVRLGFTKPFALIDPKPATKKVVKKLTKKPTKNAK